MPTYYNIYLPSSLDNNNYIYRLTDDSTVQIITNNNCVTNYTTTNCDCYDFYYAIYNVNENIPMKRCHSSYIAYEYKNQRY